MVRGYRRGLRHSSALSDVRLHSLYEAQPVDLTVTREELDTVVDLHRNPELWDGHTLRFPPS